MLCRKVETHLVTSLFFVDAKRQGVGWGRDAFARHVKLWRDMCSFRPLLRQTRTSSNSSHFCSPKRKKKQGVSGLGSGLTGHHHLKARSKISSSNVDVQVLPSKANGTWWKCALVLGIVGGGETPALTSPGQSRVGKDGQTGQNGRLYRRRFSPRQVTPGQPGQARLGWSNRHGYALFSLARQGPRTGMILPGGPRQSHDY
jgi:hypothetical protein